MSMIVPGGSHHRDYGGNSQSLLGEFATDLKEVSALVHAAGWKGVVAVVVSASVAFLPLAILLWFTFLRLTPMAPLNSRLALNIRGEQTQDDQEDDEPGETGLLQVTCLVDDYSEARPLRALRDPKRSSEDSLNNRWVDRERIYIRPAGSSLPFGLMGAPPLSAWLKAGEYEVLAMYPPKAPSPDLYGSGSGYSSSGSQDRPLYPWLHCRETCRVENRQRTVVALNLKGHQASRQAISWGEEGTPSPDPVAPIVKGIEQGAPMPTPGGIVLSLAEPELLPLTDGRYSLEAPAPIPREWTAEQLAELRRWLPESATAARAKLEGWEGGLGWRRFFSGWYFFAATFLAGATYTRWGTIAFLAPYRSDREWETSWRFLAACGFIAGALWIALMILSDGQCRGPLVVRPF